MENPLFTVSTRSQMVRYARGTHLNSIFIVGGGEDLLDNQLPCSGDDHGFVPEVRVLKQDAAILLVNADGVLNGADLAGSCWELGIEVVN